MSPCVDDLCLHVPQGCVTEKEGSIMEEPCRSDDLPIPATLRINHLGGLCAHQPDKTILLLLILLLGRKGQTDKQSKQYIEKFLHQDYSVLRNFEYHPSRSKTQSSNIGSITMYVDSIFELIKSLIAFIWSSCLAFSRRRV